MTTIKKHLALTFWHLTFIRWRNVVCSFQQSVDHKSFVAQRVAGKEVEITVGACCFSVNIHMNLTTERLVRSARFWFRCSLSLVIERVKSTGMEVNWDFTSKETMTSWLEIECCFTCCVKQLFCTVKVFFLTGDRTETKYLDTAYVGLKILLVMGRNGLPDLWIFGRP